VFKAPWKAQLTDKGEAILDTAEEDVDRYQDMTHRELVEKVHELDEKTDQLQRQLEAFRKQVQRKISKKRIE